MKYYELKVNYLIDLSYFNKLKNSYFPVVQFSLNFTLNNLLTNKIYAMVCYSKYKEKIHLYKCFPRILLFSTSIFLWNFKSLITSTSYLCKHRTLNKFIYW
jgi:hypothetical protein